MTFAHSWISLTDIVSRAVAFDLRFFKSEKTLVSTGQAELKTIAGPGELLLIVAKWLLNLFEVSVGISH